MGSDLAYDHDRYSVLDTHKTNRVNKPNGANTISTLNTYVSR